MFCAGASVFYTVDIFNATAASWSTAALSVARSGLAVTSLPVQGLVSFASGQDAVVVNTTNVFTV
jgi:hypothetical protein